MSELCEVSEVEVDIRGFEAAEEVAAVFPALNLRSRKALSKSAEMIDGLQGASFSHHIENTQVVVRRYSCCPYRYARRVMCLQGCQTMWNRSETLPPTRICIFANVLIDGWNLSELAQYELLLMYR